MKWSEPPVARKFSLGARFDRQGHRSGLADASAWMKATALFCLALCACRPSEAELLEQKYRRSVDIYGQRRSCADEHLITKAWAREGNQRKYMQAKVREKRQCMREQARMYELYPDSRSVT